MGSPQKKKCQSIYPLFGNRPRTEKGMAISSVFRPGSPKQTNDATACWRLGRNAKQQSRTGQSIAGEIHDTWQYCLPGCSVAWKVTDAFGLAVPNATSNDMTVLRGKSFMSPLLGHWTTGPGTEKETGMRSVSWQRSREDGKSGEAVKALISRKPPMHFAAFR